MPARRVRFHPLFDCDVREATAWYAKRSPRSGIRFTNDVRAAVARILAQPESFAKLPSGIRYLQLSQFPYLILFDQDSESIFLFGVLHAARSMDDWERRTGSASEDPTS